MARTRSATSETGRNALIASATKVTISDRKVVEAIAKRRDKWIQSAWLYYDEIGEVHFAYSYLGWALSQIRPVPQYQANPAEEPVDLDVAVDEGLISEAERDAAWTEIARIGNPADLQRDLGINLGVTGEGYVVAARDPADGTEIWAAYSVEEITKDSAGRLVIKDSPDAKPADLAPLPDDAIVIRHWVPHPRYGAKADSTMRAILGPCDELLLLGRAIRANAQSRLSNGILAMPDELSFASHVDGDGADDEDPFVADLIAAMTTPITDPESAAAIVPIVVRGPAEYLAAVKKIDLASPVARELATQRSELLDRIANGLPLPKEIVLGMADANHWTAWQIDEDTYKAHVEPFIRSIYNGWTSEWYRPALAIDGIRSPDRFLIGHDASALLGNPNNVENAVLAFDRGAISHTALRRELRFGEADAPDPNEIATTDPAALPTPSTGTPAETNPGPPVEDDGVTAAAPTRVAAEIVPSPRAITAAASRTRRPLGDRLAAIDARLRDRVLLAADACVSRALERAGARLRRSLQANKVMAARYREVPNRALVAAVGPGLAAQLGLDEQAILDDSLDGLHDQWDTWVDAAGSAALGLLVSYGGREIPDAQRDAIVERQAADRAAGWAILSAALLPVFVDALAGRTEPLTVGEIDATLLVRPGDIRPAIARAGGAPVRTPTERPTGPISRYRAATTGQPDDVADGIALGETLLDVARTDFGYEVLAWRWDYGDPGSRSVPFEPHLDLDGIEFTASDDEALSNPDGFPDGEFYEPGDHPGCQCQIVPVLLGPTNDEGESPDE